MIWQHEITALTLDRHDRLLIARRGRPSALAVMCSVAVFTTTDLLVAPPHLATHLVWKTVQAAIVLATLVGLRHRRLRRHRPSVVLGGLLGIIASVVPPGILRGDVITGPTLIGVMTLWSAVLFPWALTRQALVAGAGTAAILILVHTVHGLGNVPPYPLIAASIALFASVPIAHQLGVHRRERRHVEIVLRASEAQTRRASARLTEEAWTAATLLHVAETLNAHLHAPDMLDHVNRLAVDSLGYDCSHTLLWDERAGGLRVRGAAGWSREERIELESAVFPVELLDLVPPVESGRLLEQADVRTAHPVVAQLMRRFRLASFLGTPVRRDGRVEALFVHGHRVREGAFPSITRRLALGLAHTTAIALDNARLIRDLEAASTLKSEFVATMSHELRTPLNVIVGYVDMLRDGNFGVLPGPQQAPIDRIRGSALELLELIDQTLDLSRLDAGRATRDLGPVPIATLLAEITRELAPLAASGVRLSASVEPPDAVAETDRAKLKTIVKNLVGNALKFTSQGGVAIEAVLAQGVLEVAVRDTGIGIAAGNLPVIFDVFRQLDGSSTRRFGGVGLGLHIVKRLVHVLGGTVDVASVLGVGSTFAVRLPIAGEPALRSTG